MDNNRLRSIEDLFMISPAVRNMVKVGSAKVVGAIYDVGRGTVDWLSESKVSHILTKVEKHPDRATSPMASDSP